MGKATLVRGITALASVLAVSSWAHGQSWAEVGDAGDLPGTAQAVVGVGPLTQITGFSNHLIEDKDMFRIFINAGGGFSAEVTSTTPSDDPKLYLLNSAGLGVMGDDDSGAGVYPALPLGHPLLASLPAGEYFLAITDFDYIPTSAGGAIFPGGNLVGPTGPGGGQPHTGWTSDSHEASWSYTIALTGASFIPEPGSAGVLASAMVCLLARGRRRR